MKIRTATPDLRKSTIREIAWGRKHHHLFAGLPYTDELRGPNGIHLEIIAPEGTLGEQMEQAIKEGYRTLDVVSHSVMVCPVDWFSAEA
jgi:hypothetical protein